MSLSAQSLPEVDSDVPPPPKRKIASPFAFLGVVVVGALVIVGCVLGTTMSGLFNFTGANSESTEDGSSPPAEAGKGPGATFSDGQLVVGDGGDIQAGVWSTTVPKDSAGCTWERNASTSGTPSSVLEAGIAKPGATIVVSIRSTDKVFQSTGCGTWHRTGDLPPSQDTNYTDNKGGGTSD